ncbi:MAG: hypothetical protein ABFD75_12485 [Smithella sp.]
MIGVSTRIYDLNGARIFRDDEIDQKYICTNTDLQRRMSRTATLDGGVSVYDTGYAVGDRDITLRVPNAPKETIDFLTYLVKTYNEITVTTSESAFIGVPGRIYVDSEGAAVLVINLTEEIGG